MTAEPRIDALLAAAPAAATALVAHDQSLGYAELDARVSAAAGWLRGQVEAGERVALWLPKSLDYVVLFFGILRAGGVAVPVNPVLKAAQVAHILRDSGARLLLSHAPRAAHLPDPPCRLVLLDEIPADPAPAAAEFSAPGGDTLAALLYTSGSTGRPKGVMVTHANLGIGARSVAGYLGTRADDRVLAVLPLSFDFGLSQLTSAFHAGAAAVLLDYLAPRDVVAACERHRITQLAAVPPLWIRIAELDWPHAARARMRTLSNSGGRLPVPIVQQLRQLFPAAQLHLMYGLTEAFRSTTLPPDLADRHPDSIGRAIPDAEVLVVRADGTLADAGETGELVHCGPLVTQGYWRDPARTAERFRPAPPASRLGGTAVWSGDRVRRDADGLLYFVGRDDETIKTMGTRVSPTEIEEIAYQSGVVADVVALGVADELAGHRIRLVASAVAGSDATAAEAKLRRWFRTEAASYMMPDDIIWLDALPVSANGKLDRAAVRRDHGA